jgi:hypothetical protein
MNARLAHLLAELRERFPGEFDPAEVARFLKSRGVDRRAIGELVAQLQQERVAKTPRADGPLFRVEGPHERGRFAPEAWGQLLSLVMNGQLGPADFESAVERLLAQVDGRIAPSDVRALIEGIDPRDDAGTLPDNVTLH